MPTPNRPRHLAPLHGLVLSVALAAARAHAQPGSACADPRLRIEGQLAARWLTPVVDLCDSLATMRDVDPSAQLRLTASGEDVIVEATLGDGRSTLRRVRAPTELQVTVEALVAVPPELSPEPPAPSPPPAPRHYEQITVASAAPRRIGFELGASAVTRVAGPVRYVSVGVTVYAGVRSGPWLLALGGRYDGYQTVLEDRPRDFEMATAGGGFALWRQLAVFERSAFEAGLTTWLLGESQAFTPQRVELTYSSFDVRLGLGARWLYGAGPVRGSLAFDAELSPNRVRHAPHVDEDLPALPAWSTGFAVGVAWEPQ